MDMAAHRPKICVRYTERKGPTMRDLQFFVKAIWFLILCAFMWFLTMAVTGQWWVFPILFVGLCVYAVHDVRKKQRRIAYLAAEAKRARNIADEKQAIADQLAEEARAINEQAERATARLDLEAEAEIAEAEAEAAEARARATRLRREADARAETPEAISPG
jgi:hypothetical protein